MSSQAVLCTGRARRRLTKEGVQPDLRRRAAGRCSTASGLDELLLAADNALFAAKDAGRDQIRTVRTSPPR